MEVRMQQPVKVVVEHNLATAVKEILKHEHLNRPFIVLDRFLLTTPAVIELKQALADVGIEAQAYADIIPDPPAQMIDQGGQAMAAFKADSIIAIGGGSSLDSAKGINIVASLGGSIMDYLTNETAIRGLKPLISVPTTAGTGSEMSNALVITDEATNKKQAILSDNILSDYALLIPELTVSLPVKQTIASGLDAFAHAAEGYLSTLSTPMADAIAEKIMFLLYNYLPGAVKDGKNIENRQRVLVAASLAGWLLNQSGTIVAHSTAHILGAKYHLVHGEAVSYALPGVLELVAPVKPKKVKEIGKILGASFKGDETPEKIATITVKAYLHFRDKMVGLHPFVDYKLDHNELLQNADAIVNERFAGNTPVTLTHDVMVNLLEHFG